MEAFNPYAVDEAEIAQKMKLAQALQGRRGLFWQMRAPQHSEQAMQMLKALQERRQTDWTGDANILAKALQGTPGQPAIAAPADELGGGPGRPEIAPVSPQQALAQALPQMRSPAGMQMALGASKPGDAYTLKPGDIRFGPDGRVLAKGAAEKAANPEADSPYTLMPGAKRFGPKGDLIADNPRADSSTPFFTPLQTPQGVMAFDGRKGTAAPLNIGGQPVVGAQNDPTLQRNLAAAKAGGKEVGEATAQAQIDLPRVINNAQNSLGLIDQMVGSEDGKTPAHPGFESAVGLRIPGLGMIPGTETSNFNALLDQVRGGAFLEAFNSLKGGGQITEVEGKKATDAITRMSNAQSEKEFVKAAREYQQIIKLGVQRAQQKSGQRLSGPERRGVPAGVDPAVWAVMTPQEKALWAK